MQRLKNGSILVKLWLKIKKLLYCKCLDVNEEIYVSLFSGGLIKTGVNVLWVTSKQQEY